jgi:hypothetical protein
VESMQVETDRRKALKGERDLLFARYLNQPKNIELAVEIKALDDENAKSVEDIGRYRGRYVGGVGGDANALIFFASAVSSTSE